jgi:outer membrane protein assembly factor BamB
MNSPDAGRRFGRCGTGRAAPGPVRIAAILLVVLLSFDRAAPFTRGGKSVFSSQPLEWDLQFRKESKVQPIRFSVLWTFDGFHAPLAGDPLPAGDRLIAAGQDGSVAAIGADGKAVWTARLPSEIVVGPALAASTVLVARRGGRLTGLDARDGTTRWETDLGADAVFPPRHEGDRVLVPGGNQTLMAIDPGSGAITARLALPGRPSTPPEPAPGGIVIGTDHGMLLAADLPGLAVRWRRYLGSPVTAPPLVHGKRVYATTEDRRLICLRLGNGRPLWSVATGAMVTARPFTLGPWLYFLCYDDDIYVLNARNGHLMTRVRLGHRLDRAAARTADHLFVAPFTEASLVSLALPGLQSAGTFALDIPGEWFTTAPVIDGARILLGYGREQGRVLALAVGPAPPAASPAPAAGGS